MAKNGGGKRKRAEMSGSGANLTAKQQRAIAALLATPTIERAAKKAKIGESTLRRWLSEPAFRAAYDAARSELVDSAVRQLQRATAIGVATLVEIAKDKTAKPTARVAAARSLIDHTWRGTELTALQERIKRIEEAMAADERQGKES